MNKDNNHNKDSALQNTSLNKLKWCVQQKKGISLVEKNPHLSVAHMKEADETLENEAAVKEFILECSRSLDKA